MAEEEEQQTEQNQTQEKATSFTISKVLVRPGKPFVCHSSEKWENCLSCLPYISDKPDKYVPMPYTFRLPPSPKPTHIGNVVAKSPPFYLLLDHAIAVIWMLFSDEEYDSPLGIVQLQWAAAFLRTIYSRNGERPKDIELCLEKIENMLMEQYANLADELQKMNRLDESGHFADGALGSRTVVTKKFPFSKNYADMIEKVNESEVDAVASITSDQAAEELEGLKKAAGVASIEKLDSASKDKAINVLKMWYNEQTGKIKEEVKKLRVIQQQMQQVDDGEFHYLSPEDVEMFMEDDDD